MSVVIVNDYKMRKGFDRREAMAAAKDLVAAFRKLGGVQLSLWLEDQADANHHLHITVFDTEEDVERIKDSDAIERFVERYYPHMDVTTHRHPACDVLLADGAGVKPVPWTGK